MFKKIMIAALALLISGSAMAQKKIREVSNPEGLKYVLEVKDSLRQVIDKESARVDSLAEKLLSLAAGDVRLVRPATYTEGDFQLRKHSSVFGFLQVSTSYGKKLELTFDGPLIDADTKAGVEYSYSHEGGACLLVDPGKNVILLLQRFDTVEQAIRRQISSLSPMSDNNLWGMLNELRPYWFKEGRWVFATDSTWQKSIFYRSDDLKNKLVARVSTKDTMSDSINLLAVHLTIGKAGQYGEYSWESTQGIHKKNIENLQEIAEFLRGQIEEKMKKEK